MLRCDAPSGAISWNTLSTYEYRVPLSHHLQDANKEFSLSFATPGDRPAWASFVGEHQKRGLAVEPPNELFNVDLPAPDRSHKKQADRRGAPRRARR
jgi:hypothetical protein